MKRVVTTLLCLLPLSCASPQVVSKFVEGPGGSKVLPIEILGSNILRAGQDMKISNPGGATTMTVSFTNAKTGANRSRTINVDPAAPGSVLLDSSVLPDLVPDAKVQEFNVSINNPTLNASYSKDVFVVSEADIQPFPKFAHQYGESIPVFTNDGLQLMQPPGKAALVADPSEAGVDFYVQRLTDDWKLDQPDVKKASILRGEVTIPDWLRTVTESVDFVEVHIGARYAKYLIPAAQSQSGHLDVYSPTQMSIVLTKTNPAVLVTITAIPPTKTE